MKTDITHNVNKAEAENPDGPPSPTVSAIAEP